MDCIAQENLPARWLTQGQFPRHEMICRFRCSQDLIEILPHSFGYFVSFLKEQGFIDDRLFIDGTKLLTNANKYSFVWKKNNICHEEINRQSIRALLNGILGSLWQNFNP